MAEDAEWQNAIEYKKFLKAAREHVEIMKARYNDLQITEGDLEHLRSLQGEVNLHRPQLYLQLGLNNSKSDNSIRSPRLRFSGSNKDILLIKGGHESV